jgi:hypothetical protein
MTLLRDLFVKKLLETCYHLARTFVEKPSPPSVAVDKRVFFIISDTVRAPGVNKFFGVFRGSLMRAKCFGNMDFINLPGIY